MAKWRKRFEAWRSARAPVPVDEGGALLERVFGDRVTVHKGGSHRWTVDVSDIRDRHVDFQFGLIGLPVRGGKCVLPAYCKVAYRAAVELGLLAEEGDDAQEDDDA